jgi:DNA polymerase-3 subunit alpha
VVNESFVHCHVHSDYSALDGAAKITDMFAEAQRLGMPALALTDHGNMFGAAEFYRTAARYPDVKPILGIEAYVAPASRHHKQPILWGHSGQRRSDEYGEGGDVSGAGAYTHMTMLAENATGLRNLFRLSSLASFEGYYYKPRMDKELISQHSTGIIATTGCPSGEVQTRLRLGQRTEALQSAAAYRDIFGPDNFYLELMDHGLAIERSVREGLLEIGRELDLQPLATNDSHYVTRDQAPAHDALLCIQTGAKLAAADRFRFEGDSYYLKSPAEMRAYWNAEVPGACDATLAIAERVASYAEVFANVDRKPRVPLEPGDTEDAALRRAVEQGIASRFPGGLPAGYRDRLDTELAIVASMNFPGYFLVVDDLVKWARSRSIFCRARGSAAGSLALYTLRVTDMDPIVHNLYFERFLNPDRVSPPDIDIDVDERYVTELFAYLSDQWGAEYVAKVITFNTIKTKAALKDATCILGHPYAVGERLTKALPPAVGAQDVPLSGIVDPMHERYAECTRFRAEIETDTRAEQIMKTAVGLEGLIRNAGVHACGVFLGSEPLIDVIPLWKRQEDGAIITGWAWSDCEDVGLQKLDVLSSDTNAVIVDTIAAVKVNHGVIIDLDSLPLDDPAVYDLLSSGNALGVFQMDSTGMRDLLRRIRPTCFADICVATALYRPGPMGANTHNEFADRKNGRSPAISIHPELTEPLADVLSDTFLLTVYQEDVMAIARKVAGYTLGQADLLRRAMGKKKPEILAAEYARFRDGMAANGYSAGATQALWDVMVPYASYGFVKSHAASYGLVSYWTAYLKAHYPAEFMAARLTSMADKKTKRAVYLVECRRMDLTVLPPDVNESALGFTAVPAGIRFGLGSVLNVGERVVASIIATRDRVGRFTSFADFLAKVDATCLNKRMIESLIKAGVFDSLGHPRQALMAVHADAIDAAAERKRQASIGQRSLFDTGNDDESALEPLELGFTEWARAQLFAFERDQLGCYVSAHPLDGAAAALRRRARRSVGELLLDPPAADEPVTVAGLLTSVQVKMSKAGKQWATMMLEDMDGALEVRVLSRVYELVRGQLAVDAVVSVAGRVDSGEGALRLLADDVAVLDLAEATASPIVVSLAVEQCTRERVVALRSTLTRHRGDREVRLRLTNGSREHLLELDDGLRVATSTTLASELRTLLGRQELL